MKALLRLSELACTIGRAITRAGDALYNIATGTRFSRTEWDHANPVWSPQFYEAFGEQEYGKLIAALSSVRSPEFFRAYGEREWHRLHPRKTRT
ncbi:hypothetical protein [Methylocystis rosea]|uniref:hypothetical protein n=1 Tax=Methylocystis rosea TaxID=173366 RepID=UPI0003733A8F|nr:hypothetical protein [Methylocystis rosea]